MAGQGTALLDFGAFPGTEDATIDVTGQTGFTAANLAEAYIYPVATADHTQDEHLVEELIVFAYRLVDGTIRIYGRNSGGQYPPRGPGGWNLYGKWNIGWVWN